ncbi:polycomb group protein EMF2B-like [Lolium perenne]|uniref:polycomb group protein EMF2B-like n=1 Tax=Lolium perenne TaxID=4522 RepID=UPI003A992539
MRGDKVGTETNGHSWTCSCVDQIIACFLRGDLTAWKSVKSILRLRTGNVLFNYKHCKKFLKSEVTEDFSCSFCLVQCGSFKGLEYHLTSSHELFHFEFWVSEDYQAVNVSLKIDTRRAELLTTAGDDRSKRVFLYRSRFKKRCRRLGTTIEKTKHVHPHIMEPGSPRKTVPVDKGISVVQTSIDSHPALHCNNQLTPAVPLFGKTTKLSIDRADPRNRLLLEHQFFHSLKAQVIAIMQHLAIFLYVIEHTMCMLVVN